MQGILQRVESATFRIKNAEFSTDPQYGESLDKKYRVIFIFDISQFDHWKCGIQMFENIQTPKVYPWIFFSDSFLRWL